VENVGGYRLVRKLGQGERAEVWLGHSGRSDDGVMAIKIFRSGIALRSIDEEIDALARASSRHLVELRDIATAPDGRPCLVLGRLPAGSLEQLLDRRERFSPGQMVTALAPIVEAVAELHRVGVAHGGVRATAVLFDARHSPVLACFGHSRVIGPAPIDEKSPSLTMAQQAEEKTIAVDLAGLAGLVHLFASRIADPGSCQPLLAWLDAVPRSDGTLVELADRLYDVAAAAPLGVADGGRTLINRPGSGTSADASKRGQPNHVPGRHSGCQLAGWLLRSVDQNPLRALGERVKTVLGTVRRPIWIIAAVGLIAFVLAVAVIPTVDVPNLAITKTPIPEPSRSRLPGTSSAVPSAFTSDDPLLAARALVEARTSCIAKRSVRCLDIIEQEGSAALEADRYLIGQLKSGGTTSDKQLEVTAMTLIERLGNSAIVGVGTPVEPSLYPGSVLIVKVGTVWQIRELTVGASP